MKNNLKNLTILVNSCDKYDDLWEPFFKLFKKFGGELVSCPIVLNTESKQFSYGGLNITCPNNYKEPVEWGRRLRATLKEIKTDYVLSLLDDFFLQKPANVSVITQCIDWLKTNPDIGAFNLLSIKDSREAGVDFENFCFIEPTAKYRINSQACVWKKDVLYNSILDIESPWEWETYGNERNSIILNNTKFYCISELVDEPYFYNSEFHNKKYSPDTVRNAVIQGKWDLSCIEQCFKDNDIDIDYNIRGIYKPKIINTKKLSFLKRCVRFLAYRVFSNKHRKSKQNLAKKRYLLIEKPIKEFDTLSHKQ